jgi:hypothetical protein
MDGHDGPWSERQRTRERVLTISKPARERDRNHLRFVASQPCLVCGRGPSDAHHIKFAEQRAMGRKVSDKFTVPICRLHIASSIGAAMNAPGGGRRESIRFPLRQPFGEHACCRFSRG